MNNPLPTPTPENPSQNAAKKVALLQAVAQLDMLLQMFGDVPDRVKETAKAFRDSLKEWSENAG